MANKTILGVGSTSGLVGCGINIRGVSNVIVRNMNISKVLASNGNGDAIHIDSSTRLWIDHNDLSSDTSHGTDYYDGLMDITHGADYITVSWNKMHDHIKCSLVGHSDSNASEDTGHLRVTYHHNEFSNCAERNPRVRFANPVHVFNNYYVNTQTFTYSYGIATTDGAGVLVEGNYFENITDPTHLSEGDSDPRQPGGAQQLPGQLGRHPDQWQSGRHPVRVHSGRGGLGQVDRDRGRGYRKDQHLNHRTSVIGAATGSTPVAAACLDHGRRRAVAQQPQAVLPREVEGGDEVLVQLEPDTVAGVDLDPGDPDRVVAGFRERVGEPALVPAESLRCSLRHCSSGPSARAMSSSSWMAEAGLEPSCQAVKIFVASALCGRNCSWMSTTVPRAPTW